MKHKSSLFFSPSRRFQVIPPVAKLARLSCVFLSSSDLFLERPVQRLTWGLFRLLTRFDSIFTPIADLKPSLQLSSALFPLQAAASGRPGPGPASSRPGLLPGPVLCSADPVRGRVLRGPAVWLLGPAAAAEEVQRHHEAGRVRRARGDPEVAGSHSGTGTRSANPANLCDLYQFF